MSWIHKLYETYENCQSMIGKIESENAVPLLPICHTTQKAQIEVIIDTKGNFKEARIVSKENARTIIPCTEESGGRTSGEAPHPLCDKLQYVAKDYKKYSGEKKEYFESYLNNLEKWCNSKHSHLKANAVLNYVAKGNVIKDLVDSGILLIDGDGKLIDKQPKKKDRATLEGMQSDAFIRWEVWEDDNPCTKVWEDSTLWESWIKFYSSSKSKKTFCYVTGQEQFVAEQHPSKIRNDGDKAKLISSNDWSGFTFRGRFIDTREENKYQVCGVGFEVTQKAHSALRWLINRQGYKKADHAIVAWATRDEKFPDPFSDPVSILGLDLNTDSVGEPVFTAQEFALRLRKKIDGYNAELVDESKIILMGLDSATPGRMSITFYKELKGSDFLKRIEKWHNDCSWVHSYRYFDVKGQKNKRQYIKFVGAPSPNDIAESASGSKVDDKLRKTVVNNLLPCIVDGQKIPVDIVISAIGRATKRVSMEMWEWKKTLSIACALYRKYKIDYEGQEVEMALDVTRKTRDYLYGRLLALADSIEQWALDRSKEDRLTNAARLMQRFADRPFSTWRTIELALKPYEARLGGVSRKRRSMISEVMTMFNPEDFNSDKKLSGEFLLGYHCQIEALKNKKHDEIEETIE